MAEEVSTPSSILASYASGPAQLRDAIASLTEMQLDIALTAEQWTIRQIIHHVVDGDDMWKICIKAALGNTQVPLNFQWYWDKPQNEWANSWRYTTRTIEPSLALFAANRRHIEQLLQQVPAAWTQIIWIKWSHGEQRQMTVGQIIEMQSRHAMGHVQEILAIRQTRGF